ncbi:hypothetical protein HT136_01370 [Novosphingobium profundi]|uniref:hypothetical protein n=1 Tax=Novosphingobium profundi TaxID=1774954 RepID=UPI001BD9DE3C|nr:hypothetical protein [Novosphingobium profundi]MBT0667016.1 hypothetical protein [Novosphingobium profundi]
MESLEDPEGAGVRTGMRMAIDEAGPLLPLRDEQQLSLLAEEAGSDQVNFNHVGLARRGRGRPKGAGNKRREDVRSYLLSRYAHPLEVLAQMYSRPVDALAAELGCSKKEAAQVQVRAAAEVAPFVEGKMPVTVDLGVKGDFNLLIPGVNLSVEDARSVTETGAIPFAEYDELEDGEDGE